MILIIAIVIILIGVYIFTPIRFGKISLDGEYRVKIKVNGQELTAVMENNSSAHAFKKLISSKPKTVSMRDYGSMEKVGMLWSNLPTNNRRITTEPGDIILYMGGSIVVYYEPNSWDFTKLGHIEGVTKQELKNILGSGSVKMTFELAD